MGWFTTVVFCAEAGRSLHDSSQMVPIIERQKAWEPL